MKGILEKNCKLKSNKQNHLYYCVFVEEIEDLSTYVNRVC